MPCPPDEARRAQGPWRLAHGPAVIQTPHGHTYSSWWIQCCFSGVMMGRIQGQNNHKINFTLGASSFTERLTVLCALAQPAWRFAGRPFPGPFQRNTTQNQRSHRRAGVPVCGGGRESCISSLSLLACRLSPSPFSLWLLPSLAFSNFLTVCLCLYFPLCLISVFFSFPPPLASPVLPGPLLTSLLPSCPFLFPFLALLIVPCLGHCLSPQHASGDMLRLGLFLPQNARGLGFPLTRAGGSLGCFLC